MVSGAPSKESLACSRVGMMVLNTHLSNNCLSLAVNQVLLLELLRVCDGTVYVSIAETCMTS